MATRLEAEAIAALMGCTLSYEYLSPETGHSAVQVTIPKYYSHFTTYFNGIAFLNHYHRNKLYDIVISKIQAEAKRIRDRDGS